MPDAPAHTHTGSARPRLTVALTGVASFLGRNLVGLLEEDDRVGRIVGIDIDAEPERVRADVLTCAEGAAALLDHTLDPSGIEVVAGHAGPAYGVPHAATLDAIRLGARLEALVLDPVYSGKGLAGLIALVQSGRWTQDQDVVFVHTGGAPALFAYRHLFQD